MVSSGFMQSYLIKSISSSREFVCLAECNRKDECSTVSFDKNTLNCSLFRNINKLTSVDTISNTNGNNLFIKKRNIKLFLKN
jgi:hypothetical protein